MNKRKPDDEFARINLSYIDSKGQEVIVYCPESKNSSATQNQIRRVLENNSKKKKAPLVEQKKYRKGDLDFCLVILPKKKAGC